MLTEMLTERVAAHPLTTRSNELHHLVDLVHRQTQKNVRDLSIYQLGDQLVVTGQSPTYYVKQLVTQVLRIAVPSLRLVNDICVG